ncbi:MAG: thiamine-binding protein [Candidatus Leucobacter sulfamidivorax]|nr:thiamine-binding protein [Candidatus Leucobacter sulfamidivorax]
MILAFSVAPSGGVNEHPDGSVSEAVAQAVKVVRESGLPHRTSSMFTEVEGEWDEVFDVVKRATEAVLPYGSRVSLVMKADIRPGASGLAWDAQHSTSEARAATAAPGEIEGKLERLERAIDAS